MENQKQVDFLKTQLENAIKSLHNRRMENKRKAFRIQIATTILSAVSTIVLGLKVEGKEEHTRIFALIVSSTITVITAIDAFYNHKRLWLTYADSLNAMYALRYDFDYRLFGTAEITVDELNRFKDRYQEILNNNNEKWMKMRLDDGMEKGNSQ